VCSQASEVEESEPHGDEDRASALKDLIGESQAEKVLELDRLVSSVKGATKIAPIVLEPESDKSKRTAVHMCIKKHFKSLATDSVKVDGSTQTAIRVFPIQGGGNWENPSGSLRPNKRQRTGDALYQGRSPDLKFVKFVLLKENYDTMSAVSTIAHLLRVSPGTFAYAGTKVQPT
jgi:tRNA pseudouridine13 synthase